MTHPAVVQASWRVFNKTPENTLLEDLLFPARWPDRARLPLVKLKFISESVEHNPDGHEVLVWGNEILTNPSSLPKQISRSSNQFFKAFLQLAAKHDDLLHDVLKSTKPGLIDLLWNSRGDFKPAFTLKVLPFFVRQLDLNDKNKIDPVKIALFQSLKSLGRGQLTTEDYRLLSEAIQNLTDGAKNPEEANTAIDFIESVRSLKGLKIHNPQFYAELSLQCAKVGFVLKGAEEIDTARVKEYLHETRSFLLSNKNEHHSIAAKFNMYSARIGGDLSSDQQGLLYFDGWQHALKSGDPDLLLESTLEYATFLLEYVEAYLQASEAIDAILPQLLRNQDSKSTDVRQLVSLRRTARQKHACSIQNFTPRLAFNEAVELMNNAYAASETHLEEYVQLEILAEDFEDQEGNISPYLSFARSLAHIKDCARFASDGKPWAISYLIELTLGFCESGEDGVGLYVVDELMSAIEDLPPKTLETLKIDVPDLKVLRTEFYLALHYSDKTTLNDFLEKAVLELAALKECQSVLSADGQITSSTNTIEAALCTQKYDMITEEFSRLSKLFLHPESSPFRVNRTLGKLFNCLETLNSLEQEEVDTTELSVSFCEMLIDKLKMGFSFSPVLLTPMLKILTLNGFQKEAAQLSEAIEKLNLGLDDGELGGSKAP